MGKKDSHRCQKKKGLPRGLSRCLGAQLAPDIVHDLIQSWNSSFVLSCNTQKQSICSVCGWGVEAIKFMCVSSSYINWRTKKKIKSIIILIIDRPHMKKKNLMIFKSILDSSI